MPTMPALILAEEQILVGVTKASISQHFSHQNIEILSAAGQTVKALQDGSILEHQAQ